MTTSPIPSLTGLRFFAASFVMFFHSGAGYLDQVGAPRFLVTLLNNGNFGVSIFFVLSGYILYYNYAGARMGLRFLQSFYVARFARLYPVYLLALLLALPVLHDPLSLGDAVQVLTMVQAWTPMADGGGFKWLMQAWTLSVEFFFYLVFPLLLLVVPRLSFAATLAALAGVGGLIVVFALSCVAPGQNFHDFTLLGSAITIPLLRLPEFLYGVLLCHLRGLDRGGAAWPSIRGLDVLLVAAVIVMLGLSSDLQVKSCATLLIGGLIVVMSANRGPVSALFSLKAVVLLGAASYCSYIMNGPLRALAGALLPHPLDRALTPVITIVFALAVFRYYEQPVRRHILAWRKKPPVGVGP